MNHPRVRWLPLPWIVLGAGPDRLRSAGAPPRPQRDERGRPQRGNGRGGPTLLPEEEEQQKEGGGCRGPWVGSGTEGLCGCECISANGVGTPERLRRSLDPSPEEAPGFPPTPRSGSSEHPSNPRLTSGPV